MSLPIILACPHFTDYTPDADPIRDIERRSIREFVESCADKLKGRVLDFGCGQSHYQGLVDGEYVGYDIGWPFPVPSFDAILCTQVVQYLGNVPERLVWFRRYLNDGGWLVLTYPTNWDEVEPEDLQRFTHWGMEKLVKASGFKVEHHDKRAAVRIGKFEFPLGYGLLARAE